ncbi:AraC family transcriptional regulator [Nitratireductor sp. XY-223]|uniref:AraC family transcriptional regulator n=1 Tax=Nitratireductor sp. XY-223 TaxID=2561926 RepID=UPI0010A9D545|nr:AraC family transcriptional regulator [Nitratireductor sp. XY-223]
MFRAENIDCALHDRVFTLPARHHERSWRGILLTSGSGLILSHADETHVSATSLAWVPWSDDKSLKISAGSVGAHFAVTHEVLSHAIGHGAEATELRLLSDRQITVHLEPGDAALADAQNAFNVILREAARMQIGSLVIIEAQVRTILVHLMRHATDHAAVAKNIGKTARVLQHFRQLMETHFRERWPISRYAAEIGISPDRLHDICTRHLERAPSVLITERVIHEARLMLENTAMTTEQVSGQLGFRDPGHFSRFFKGHAGMPPAAYRRWCLENRESDTPAATVNFADWP